MSSSPSAKAQAMMRSGRGPTNSAGVRGARRRSAGVIGSGRGAASGRPVMTFVGRSPLRSQPSPTWRGWARPVTSGVHSPAIGRVARERHGVALDVGRVGVDDLDAEALGALARGFGRGPLGEPATVTLARPLGARRGAAALLGLVQDDERRAEARRGRVVDAARTRHPGEQLVPAPVGDPVLLALLVEQTRGEIVAGVLWHDGGSSSSLCLRG